MPRGSSGTEEQSSKKHRLTPRGCCNATPCSYIFGFVLSIFKHFKRRDWLLLFACVALIICEVWLELTMPDYTASLSSSVSVGTIDMDAVWHNGLMMLLCALGSGACALCGGLCSALIAANISRTLASRLFEAVTSFSDEQMNTFGTASLITRTTNDVVQVQMLVAMGTQLVIKAPITAAWAIGKISSKSPEWTLSTLVTVCIILAVVAVLTILCLPRFRRIQKLTDELNRVTRENISGVRVVRAFNAEAFQEEKFGKVNEAVTRNNLFTSRTMGLMFPTLTLCLNGLTLAIYWIGAVLINQAPLLEKAVLMGEMIAFVQYAIHVVMSFVMLVVIFVLLPRTIVSARRINEVLTTKLTVVFPGESAGLPPVESDRGRVEFRNVSFAYSSGGGNCLENLSFTIEPGQTFAIIGATGSGKTTLINLIPRFYDPTCGQILIGGRPLESLTREEIRSSVSIAPQKAVLFKGTVKSNVTYGSDAEVRDDDPALKKALDIAHAEFVDGLPGGVNAPVAQGGMNLSGGQKQRLSIARAVYKDSDIVIFDDTFSALDYRTDKLVRQALKKELQGRTVIIVAQRIGTIRNADRILVLDGGRIAGTGRHEELLKSCPVYREIALSQLSEEEL